VAGGYYAKLEWKVPAGLSSVAYISLALHCRMFTTRERPARIVYRTVADRHGPHGPDVGSARCCRHCII